MISIAEAVGEIIRNSPFLEEGLAQGIINLSALARQIQNDVAAKAVKEATEGAIIMALKRLGDELSKSEMTSAKQGYIRNLTVRSNLSEYTFAHSPQLLAKQKLLMEEVEKEPELFLNLSHGLFETTIIVSSNLAGRVEELMNAEKMILKIAGLASITVKQSVETVNSVGVYYTILKQLAWQGINIIEVVSTFTELTLLFYERDVDRAFSALMKIR